MNRYVRYSLNPDDGPTTPDSNLAARYGIFGVDVPKEARLLPPCWPTKIVCVGRNYRDHAKELGNEVPAEPLIFLKPPSSLNAHEDDIVYPPQSERLDFEGELGVVIGQRARHVKNHEAHECILGYTVVNDVTARDLQKKDGQWTRGKGCDTFCPVGPWLIKKEEVDFASLRIRTTVNGEARQDGSVQDMIFTVPDIIAYITQFMTLEPGDLIATGTPSGVGPIRPGDTVEVTIEAIGTLRNRIRKQD